MSYEELPAGRAPLPEWLLEDLKRFIARYYVPETEEKAAKAARPAGAPLPVGAPRPKKSGLGFQGLSIRRRKPHREEADAAAPLMSPKEESVCPDIFSDSCLSSAPAPMAESNLPSDLEEVLRGVEQGFTDHLMDLLTETGEKDSEVYRRAGVSRQLFNKIINDPAYRPTKATALQLAIGLRLDVVKTQKLLESAGYSLSRSSKSDLVVEYFLRREEYDLITINTALYDCGLPLLGRA